MRYLFEMRPTLEGKNLLLEEQILFKEQILSFKNWSLLRREENINRRVLPLQVYSLTLMMFIRGILAVAE